MWVVSVGACFLLTWWITEVLCIRFFFEGLRFASGGCSSSSFLTGPFVLFFLFSSLSSVLLACFPLSVSFLPYYVFLLELRWD